MKERFLLIFIFSLPGYVYAQLAFKQAALDKDYYSNAADTEISPYRKKLLQRNHGAILGVQRGAVTSIEIGAEAHWRKLSFTNPTIKGATANLSYNFRNHVIGYQVGMWAKRGRVNLTYGGNVVYYSNFKGLNQYGVGPAVGFRLAGFHLINGYNFLVGDNFYAGDKQIAAANTLYITLRYYFPVENKFTWDRKTMKKKKERKREKEKKKKQRLEEKENNEEKTFWKKLRLNS
jgi:hypothetical protein